MPTFDSLNRKIIACERCPRLRQHCLEVARVKRRAFLHLDYWGRPVPNFGDPKARLLVVGLAPAAHGGNRTGRMFTGDGSTYSLYRCLHKAGFANQPDGRTRDDGLELADCVITAVGHCAPPANKPTTEEIANCAEWLEATFDALPTRVYLALGGIAWRALNTSFRKRGWFPERPPKFGHGVEARLTEGRTLLGSYHPSQQNTFTGRLTLEMMDATFLRARTLLAPK